MTKLGFGIIGTNFISDWFADAIRSLDSAEAVAVYSRTRERGADFAARHGIKKAYSSLGELLSDSSVSVVYVASPNHMHAPQAIEALSSGKHALVEKVIATSSSELSEMMLAAERSSTVLLEAMRPDFDPAYRVIEEGIEELGGAVSAHLEFSQYSSRYDKFKAGTVENAFNPKLLNSALADIGIYPLRQAIRLFGEPSALVSAEASFLHNGFLGEGSATLDFGSLPAKIVYSKIRDSKEPSEIVCRRGSILIDKISAPTRIEISGREPIIIKNGAENMKYEIRAFCEMVGGVRDYRKYIKLSEIGVRYMEKIYDAVGMDFENL